MANIVKITTLERLLNLLCPPTCRGCGRRGELLCGCCKNYNSLGGVSYCPICHRPEERGLCAECALTFDGVYMCGWKDELIGRMLKEYKYQSVRAMSRVFAEMLNEVLPEVAGEVVIVPLPTIGRHVRERGFDHIELIAKRLARARGWKVEKMLRRAANTVQVGASKKKRREQAGKAYGLAGRPREGVIYLLLDDIWTTGSSMMAAEQLLRQAGATTVIAAVVAVSRPRGESKRNPIR